MISSLGASILNLQNISLISLDKFDGNIPNLRRCGASSNWSSSSSGSSQSTQNYTFPLKKKKSRAPSKVKTLLPADFQPGPFTVLCGRNRECFEWVGNERFRTLCNSYMQDYVDAPGKLEKSRIVTKIMRTIKTNSPHGSFVAFENGRYYEVSPRTAREKVGAFFRDSLYDVYRSSSKAKLARKKAEQSPFPFLVHQPAPQGTVAQEHVPCLQEEQNNGCDIIDMKLLECIAPVEADSFRDGRGKPFFTSFSHAV